MFALSSEIRFHHYSQATDMRKSFYVYIGIAQNILGRNPCNDDVLIFIKKRRIKIKLRWDNLMTGTMDGSLGVDNNLAENYFRLIVLGQNNNLFACLQRGTERVAIFYSFFGT